MGYVVNFTDNAMVTAEYLNQAASELGGGVLDFADDMTYGVDDLNSISAELISKGVVRGCELSVAENSVTVGQGALYMSDGRRVVIDANGVTMAYTPGSLHYVWFGYDAVSGFVSPQCTTESPDADDFVLLGQVTAAGTVTGKPDQAVMKHSFLGLHSTEKIVKENFRWNGTEEETLLWEIEPQDVGYQYVMAYSPGYTDLGMMNNAFCGVVHLTDGQAMSTMSYKPEGDGHLYARPYESDNGEILIACSVNTNNVGAGGHPEYHYIYLRFELGNDQVLRVYQRAETWRRNGYNTTGSVDITIVLC